MYEFKAQYQIGTLVKVEKINQNACYYGFITLVSFTENQNVTYNVECCNSKEMLTDVTASEIKKEYSLNYGKPLGPPIPLAV